jgi:hypothetical protein
MKNIYWAFRGSDVEAGIEGGIHAMQNLWELHWHAEDWGFLLIDAKNAFNEQNRTAMLWTTVYHEWPSGAGLCSIAACTGPHSCSEATKGAANFLCIKEGAS